MRLSFQLHVEVKLGWLSKLIIPIPEELTFSRRGLGYGGS